MGMVVFLTGAGIADILGPDLRVLGDESLQ
jgi:hypothetical protein